MTAFEQSPALDVVGVGLADGLLLLHRLGARHHPPLRNGPRDVSRPPAPPQPQVRHDSPRAAPHARRRGAPPPPRPPPRPQPPRPPPLARRPLARPRSSLLPNRCAASPSGPTASRGSSPAPPRARSTSGTSSGARLLSLERREGEPSPRGHQRDASSTRPAGAPDSRSSRARTRAASPRATFCAAVRSCSRRAPPTILSACGRATYTLASSLRCAAARGTRRRRRSSASTTTSCTWAAGRVGGRASLSPRRAHADDTSAHLSPCRRADAPPLRRRRPHAAAQLHLVGAAGLRAVAGARDEAALDARGERAGAAPAAGPRARIVAAARARLARGEAGEGGLAQSRVCDHRRAASHRANVVTCHAGSPVAYSWDTTTKALAPHTLAARPAAPITAVAISACGNFAFLGSAIGAIDK